METIGTYAAAMRVYGGVNTGYALGAAPVRLPPLAQPAAAPDPAPAESSGYLRYLRVVVNAMDAAMTAEGVDAEVRDRVVARVMGMSDLD